MRRLGIPILILLCATSVFAQPWQANQDGQSAAPTVPKQEISAATTRHAGLEPRAGGKIAPDAPVVILERPCDQSPKGTQQSGCKSVVTRAEIDSLLDVLQPNATPEARRQFAVDYAKLFAASEAAKRRHLETDPAVAKQLLMQQKLVSMQVLANTLYRQIEAEASKVPIPEIEKYYSGHQLEFERGGVRRLVVPKQFSSQGTLAPDSLILKTKAEQLQTRAAAGEDFDKLQQVVYEDLGIKGAISNTKLNMVRRANLSAEESKVFDLNPGQVTPVLDLPSAFVVLKLESKKTLSLEDAKAEIVPFLQRERARQEIRDATENGQAKFNLQYFGLVSAPELFPPPQVTGLEGERRTQSDFSQRMGGRNPMMPRRREVTVSPLTPR
jgi:hypothetical protein